MKKLFTVLFILLAINAFSQQKYALVIGNDNYTSFGRLPNAINDANDIRTALVGMGFTVDIITDGSRGQMIEAIDRFKNRLSVSKNSYGFFFYAGHGLQHNGVNYLIPSNANIPNVNYLGEASVSVQSMLAELNDAGNDLNVVVLDACRDFPAAWSRSTNRGLTVVANQPADSIIVYATSAGSVASDGTGRNGLFTSHLLRYMDTHELEVSEMFRLTGAAVAQASGRQQIPAVYNQFFGRAFLGTQPAEQSTPTVIVSPTPSTSVTQQPETQRRPVPDNTVEGISFSTSIAGSVTTANPITTYPVVILFPGSVSVNITSDGSTRALPDKGGDVNWLNSSGVKINGSNDGFNFPYNESKTLNAGVYYIEIVGRSGFGNTGTYSIRVDYLTNEREPNNTRINAQLLIPGLTVSGQITAQDKIDMYQYELPRPGRLTVNVNNGRTGGFATDHYSTIYTIRWLDADGTVIGSSNRNLNNVNYNDYMDLEAGNYFIEITSNYTGAYTLRGEFISVGNNEAEPNNTRTTAQLLTSGQTVTGFISHQDKTDMYRYELIRPGRLTLNVNNNSTGGFATDHYSTIYTIRWLDADGTAIGSSNRNLNNVNYSGYMDLEAGNYLFEITSNYSGAYTLLGEFLNIGNNEMEPNNTRTTSQLLTSGQTVTGFISHQDKIDMYRYELKSPGRLTINVNNGRTGGFATDHYSTIYTIRWLDADGTAIGSSNRNLNNVNYSGYMDLETGFYLFEITSNYSGAYILRGDFLNVGNNEMEPNNTRTTAQLLTSGQTVTGFISHEDKIDMYRYELRRPGRMTVNLNNGRTGGFATDHYSTIYTIQWLDANGTVLKSSNRNLNNVNYTDHMDLDAGNYFVEITSNYSGTYNLTIR